MAQYASVQIPTENARVEVRSASGSWKFIPGVASVTESGGESPTRTVSTLQNKITVTGNVNPPTISISVAAYVPHHSTMKLIQEALVNNTILQWRYVFQPQTLFTATGNANTVAIATTGVVTFAGTGPSLSDEAYGPGIAIKLGSAYHVIDSIDGTTGRATVDPAPGSQIAATADYTIEIPPIYRPSFPARVTMTDNTEAGSESSLATEIGIAPMAVLPQFVVGTPTA